MTIKHLFPEAWPTLNLDFANELALDPRITFSRSSTGTYVDKNGIIQTAAEDEPRFDYDPVTGESMGLLIEGSRTNLITYSEDLADSSWFAFNSPTITNSVMASPKGNSSVSTIEQTSSSQQLVSAQYLTLTVGQQYTFSCFAKSGNHGWFRLTHVTGDATGCWFDLENGVMGTVNSDGASMTAYPNGWYRITNTFTATESTSTPVGGVPQLALIALARGDGQTQPASIGQNVHVWGVQLTEASFPSSYISTSGSAEDRAADDCSIGSFSSWYNQTEGSFIYDVNVNTDYAGIAELRAGGNSGSRGRFMRQNDAYYMRLNGGKAQVNGSLTYPNGSAKLAYRMEPGNHQQVTNGAIENSYAGGNFGGPIPLYNKMWIGLGENLSVYLNGHIARIAYYSQPLNDEQLQALTS